jgi:hypothetical protein
MPAALIARGAEVSRDPAAVKALDEHLTSLRGINTLEVQFACEKRLALLDSPLVSSGRLWIRGGHDGAVRFSTQKPYVSELILVDGKVHARSQHEITWTTTNQAARPGLTAVMLQLGGWSTGQGAGLTEMYAVTRAANTAKLPTPPEQAGKAGMAAGAEPAELFVLTPVNKDLAIAVKRVTVAMVAGEGDKRISRLAFLEIVTAQDDVTRYWFFGGQVNAALPADVFKPAGGPPPVAVPADGKP